jgi:hypothetical protein
MTPITQCNRVRVGLGSNHGFDGGIDIIHGGSLSNSLKRILPTGFGPKLISALSVVGDLMVAM